MTLSLGCIADDYTGASDLANTLARNGMRTVQTIGLPTEAIDLSDFDAIVMAFKIRSVPSHEAVSAALEAQTYLRRAGARHIMYKICSTFDSTDQGNIGPVLEALAAAGENGIVPVTPAFPITGRSVYMGNLFVGQVLLHESPLKDHPLNPMRDPDLVRVLQRQMKGKVGLVPLSTMSSEGDTVLDALRQLEGQGFKAAVMDAVFERDLMNMGEAVAQLPLSVGASGLGLGLAHALRSRKATSPTPRLQDAGGLTAILAGSCSQATLEQIAVAEKTMPVLRLDQDKLVAGTGEVERAVAFAQDHLHNGPLLIAASAAPEAVAAIQSRFGREQSGHAIEQAMATLSEALVAQGVRKLVVAGGETSGAVVDRLGISAFEIGPEIAPGVPLLRTIGRDGSDLQMALKSGNFGGSDFFGNAIGMMR